MAVKKIHFRLEKSKGEEKPIALIYRFNGQKFLYPTQSKIKADLWDPKAERPVLSADLGKAVVASNQIIKNILDRHETKLREFVGVLQQTSVVSKENLKAQMDAVFRDTPEKREKVVSRNFFPMIDEFISRCEKGKRRTKKGGIISKQRLSHYRTFKKNLMEYRAAIDVEKIDLQFYNDFIAHRYSQGKALNTVGKEINILKSILRDTCKWGLHNNRIYEHDDFTTFSEDIENIFLDDNELKQLWKTKLTGNLEITRDVFMIGCYTGLRISDLGVLEKFNIMKGGNMLKIIPDKTDDPVFIPIHYRVKQVLKKYKGHFPKAFPDQTMNDYLKIIGQKAGFDEVVQYRRTEGGHKVDHIGPKYERITNHTARRSFATNLFLAGFDVLSIMKITGHKTEKSFMRYICVSKRQIAERMLHHPYFKAPLRKKKNATG